jgi:hypothetical protein
VIPRDCRGLRIQFENDGVALGASRVLCKNSNEFTLQSFNGDAFVAESGVIAEHFSSLRGCDDFLIIKSLEAPRASHKREPIGYPDQARVCG